MKIKAEIENDETAAALSNRRFALFSVLKLAFFSKRVRTDANIECLACFVIMLMRAGKGLDNFDSCPASHDIPYTGFIEGRSVHQAFIRFAWRRCVRRFVCMIHFFTRALIGSYHVTGIFGLFFVLR
jgi:hypothetical protein